MKIDDKIEWNSWMLLVAVLALIASVLIPFAQKKYEEYRAKRNFQYYLKKQIGLILNLLTSEKLDYHEPSVKNEPKKELLPIKDFIGEFYRDFKENKNTVQPRVIFMLLMNVQNLCHFAYQLRRIISTIDLQGITDKTLEHGKELSNKELSRIYGLILICESYMSISLFHDKFGSIKSIKREIENDNWKGLKVEKDLLTNQNRLNEDLLLLNDNENNLKELSEILLIINEETKKYFDYDKLQEKRIKINR
jgi:hypothetical protein